jgi:3-oxoacyl-[acyl-carrier-protein] synthase I
VNLSLSVAAAGMVTAVGYDAASTLAALRAGVSGIRTLAWQDPESGEPYRCARVSLPQRWGGAGLLADLAAPAIRECLSYAADQTLSAVPLLLGVSNPARPGRPAAPSERVLSAISERIGGSFHPSTRVFATDQTGCAHALLEARRIIEQGLASEVIIAGVDSFIDRETVDAFAQRRRILTAANSNGFLPGEAGAAVLLTASPEAGEVRITGWGQSHESATVESTQPLRGVGMTQAVRAALGAAGTDLDSIAFRLTDLSGEHYKFKEAMFVAMRLGKKPRGEQLQMWHPIEFLGEIGAAIVPCLLAWMSHAVREGYAPGTRALCHVGSDDGDRIAFIVEASGSERGLH